MNAEPTGANTAGSTSTGSTSTGSTSTGSTSTGSTSTGPRPKNPNGSGALLVVDNLKTTFRTERGTVRAVDGVTFSLTAGTTLGVVGESGSGKTVLSRSIMGLLPSNANVDGRVEFAGADISELPLQQRRHLWGAEMSMIFQNPMTSLNPVMRVGEQIAEPLRIHLKMSKGDAAARAVELMDQVRIPSPERRARNYPHELSGGMRQRVMTAIALACNPTVLFADEPTTALDVTVQAQILELIDQQRAERNMSVVLVTHDLGVVAGHTDEVAVMYGGRLVEKAPTSTLFANMLMPYTMSLLRSIPKVEQPPHTRLFTIPGRPPDLVNPPPGCRFAPRCAYARERCHQEDPPLVSVTGDPDHTYACWFPVGSDEFNEVDEQITAGLAIGGGAR